MSLAGRIAYCLIVLIALFAPAASGSVPFAYLVVLNSLLALAVLLAPAPQRPKRIIQIFFCSGVVWVLLTGLQLWAFDDLPPPSAHRFLDFEAAGLDQPFSWLSDFHGFFYGAGLVLAGGMAFWLGLAFGQERNRAGNFLAWIVYGSAVLTLFYLVMFNVDPTWLNFGIRRFSLSNFSGGFVGRNNAATWFGSLLILGIVFWIRNHQRYRGFFASRYQRSQSDLVKATIKIGLPLIVTFIFLAALALTSSRAGFAASLGGVLIVITLSFFRRSNRQGRLIMVALMIALVLSFTLVSDLLVNRLHKSDSSDDPRWSAFQATFDLILDYPWTGIGLGGFSSAFQVYRPQEFVSDFVWDRAHNVPLQIAAEMGLPFAFVVIVLWFALLIFFVRHALSSTRSYWFSLAAVGIMVQNSIHSLVDFSLQIPGYLVVFGLIIGAIAGRSTAPRPM